MRANSQHVSEPLADERRKMHVVRLPLGPGGIRAWVSWALRCFRPASVATDSLMLFANTLINAVLGVLYWTVAARQYDIAAVGFTSAVVSATTLIAMFSNLGLGPVVLRYLPVAGGGQRRLAVVSAMIPAAFALVVTTVLATAPAGPAIAAELQGRDLATTLLPIALTIATAVMLVQDSICIAQRRSGLVLLRGAGSAIVRFALLVPCARLGSLGLVAAFTAGVIAAVALGASVWWRPPHAHDQHPTSLRQMALYGATNYVSGIFSQTPQLLYPILIARYVSHGAAGAFAFVWMASSLLMALPPSVANVLLTRLVDRRDQERQIRTVICVMVVVCTALACVMFVAVALYARIVLPAAADDIQAFLPILLASTVLYAIVRLQSMTFALRPKMSRLLVLNGCVALAAVGLPILLLPRFGVQGLEAGWLLSQLAGVALGAALQRSVKRNKRLHSPISPAQSYRFWKKDLPVQDLLIALVLFLLPLWVKPLGPPQALFAALNTASMMIWPGYVLSRLLWKRQQLNSIQQLALVPFLSVLLIVAISLAAWVVLQQVAPQLVYTGLLIVMMLMVLGLLVSTFVFRSAPPAAGEYRVLSGALMMFAGLMLIVALAVVLPQAPTGIGQLALYLAPNAAPTFDQASKSLKIPLILTNPQDSSTKAITLRAEIMGRAILTEQIALAPGEQKQVTLTIPSASLRSYNSYPIDIQVQPLGASGERRMLRVWLQTEQKKQ